jgi:anti-sigma factor RsiW
MNAQHLTTDELADAAEGLLDPERAAFAESHIADCADCQAQSHALRGLTATLRAEPAPRMPEAVAQRLNTWWLRSRPDERRQVLAQVGWYRS